MMLRCVVFASSLLLAGLLCLGQQPRAWWQSVQQIAVSAGGGGSVAFDVAAQTSGCCSQASPYNGFSMTPGGTANALVIGVVFDNAFGAAVTGVGVTWNSVAMTLITNTNKTAGASIYLFGLLSPATGNHSASVTWTGTTSGIVVSGTSWTGVNGTFGTAFTGSGTTGTVAPVTLTVSSATSHGVVGLCSDGDGVTITAITATQIYLNNDEVGNGSDRIAPASASNALTCTITGVARWSFSGVDISP